jgi:hypothetical protein
MSGVRASGADDLERAYDFLSKRPVQELFGDAAPRDHLREGRVRQLDNSWREVTFREYQGGIPVDGAYLTLLMSPQDRVTAVLARFVHFPRLPPPGATPITESTARTAAEEHYANLLCGADTVCRTNTLARASPAMSPAELVLLSPAIYEGWGQSHEELTWKFSFPGAVVYWDALQNVHRLSWETTQGASFWYETWAPGAAFRCRNTHSCQLAPPRDRMNGFELNGEAMANAPFSVIPFSDGGVHPDIARVSGFVENIDSWFVGNFGWRGPRGDAGFMAPATEQQVYVEAEPPDNAFSSDLVLHTTSSTTVIPVVQMGVDVTAQDVYAHEFMHHPTRYEVGYARYLEHGSLDESLSDIAALVSTPPPDGGWDFGVLTALAAAQGKPVRNLHTPELVDDAIQHVSKKSRCDTTQTSCIYQWLGIPNRAAALIAEGLPDGGGLPLGRLGMADLFLSPVLQPVERKRLKPPPSNRFLNQMLYLVADCKRLTALQPPRPLRGGATLSAVHCDFIEDAYREVGVEGIRAAVAPFDPTHRPKFEEVSLFAGRRLRAGCTVREHVLTVELYQNSGQAIELTSSSLSSPPLSIRYPNEPNNWQLAVVKSFRGADTDGADRAFRYTVETKWLDPPFMVLLDERLQRPAGVASDAECVNTPGTFEVELWSTPAIFQRAHFFDGDRGTSPVNIGWTSPCRVTAILGVHQHNQPTTAVHVPVQGVDHGGHGYFVTPTAAGPKGLDAEVRWFHDGSSSIFVRVAYRVEQPESERSNPNFCVNAATILAPVRAP